MVSGWTAYKCARAMNLSASPHEHRIRGVGRAEAIGSDDDKPAGSGHALAIIVPTAIGWPAVASAMLVPKLIADAGENASLRFLDFFTANIRNPNTRAAYAVAVRAARGGAHAPRLGLRRSSSAAATEPRPPNSTSPTSTSHPWSRSNRRPSRLSPRN